MSIKLKSTDGCVRTLRIVEPRRRSKKVASKIHDTVELERDIILDPRILDTYNYSGWKPIHHDLLVVSAAVEYADRRWRRHRAKWSRSFKVSLPVVEIETWKRRDVQENLRAVLRHLTGDEWLFSFVRRKNTDAIGAGQRLLPFAADREFVIAYSDGLDSRCVANIYGGDERAICVRVAKTNNPRKTGDKPFDQIPFRVHPRSAGEAAARSRGFKFAAVTAIVAHVAGIEKIIVPESGQGALGPALVPLHNVYTDYRNHPTYFRRMESFVLATLGHSVRYHQPRLWNTKGETIAAYRHLNHGSMHDLTQTRSCWQQRWNSAVNGKRLQCGLCAACLLRRMSLRAAGIEEPDENYVIADLAVPRYSDALHQGVRQSRTMIEYASVGARHMQRLADMSRLPEVALQAHAFEIAWATEVAHAETMKNLRRMLLAHAEEWHAFMAAQGKKSFLRDWTEGGRHD